MLAMDERSESWLSVETESLRRQRSLELWALRFLSEAVFDTPGDLIDRLRVAADRVQLATLTPAGHAGHAGVRGVQADRATHDERHRVDEPLRTTPAVVRVADAESVCDLVDENAD